MATAGTCSRGSCGARTFTPWFATHLEAFAELGGVPREVLYDRMKTAVLGEDDDGLVRYHPTLLDVARHFGFGFRERTVSPPGVRVVQWRARSPDHRQSEVRHHRACYHDPEVQRPYAGCAEGYGFKIEPCPVRDPKKTGTCSYNTSHLTPRT